MSRIEEIKSQILTLEMEMATLAGEGLLIRDADTSSGGWGHQQYREEPKCGALVEHHWSDGCRVTWYPTTDRAKAALAVIARDANVAVDRGGFYADLGGQGSYGASAYVTRLGKSAVQGFEPAKIEDENA